jgi:hypothetical protein
LFEESIKYSHKRVTFGKKRHQQIRNKLAAMARQIEATHGWRETLIFQTQTMDIKARCFHQGRPYCTLEGSKYTNLGIFQLILEFCASRSSADIWWVKLFTVQGEKDRETILRGSSVLYQEWKRRYLSSNPLCTLILELDNL